MVNGCIYIALLSKAFCSFCLIHAHTHAPQQRATMQFADLTIGSNAGAVVWFDYVSVGILRYCLYFVCYTS